MTSTFKQPYAHFDLTSGCRLGIGIVLPVFPFLVPPDWSDAARNVCRPIVSDPLAPQIPLAALAYVSSGVRLFVEPERLVRLNRTKAQVYEEALANLKKRCATWKLRELEGDTGEALTYAVCDDELLAAERILDKTFLMKAIDLLRTSGQVVVGVPRREMIVVTSLNHPQETLRRFKYAVQAWYAESGEDGLSPLLFRVFFGRLMGVVRFDGQLNLPPKENGHQSFRRALGDNHPPEE